MIDVKFVRHVRSISKENTIFITLAKDVTFLSEIFSKGDVSLAETLNSLLV